MRQQYFIGFIPPISSNIELSTILSNMFSTIGDGIQQSNFCAVLTNSIEILEFCDQYFQINCCDYVYESLMKILAQVFLDIDNQDKKSTQSYQAPLDKSNHTTFNQNQSLIPALQKANLLINYINTNHEFALKVFSYNNSTIETKNIFLKSIDWNNLISISSSLLR